MTSIVQVYRACKCRPDFVYKSEASFQAHFKSQRHDTWSIRNDLRDCQIKIKVLEQDNARLTRVTDALTMNLPAGAVVTRSVTTGQKKNVAARQLWKCNRCDTLLNERYKVDHIIPLFKGGTNDLDNLQAMCPNCHTTKTGKERRITQFMHLK